MKKNILILGGTGLIGLNLVKRLYINYNIFVCSRFTKTSFDYIRNLFPEVFFYQVNIENIDNVNFLIKNHKIDIIIDCVEMSLYNQTNSIDAVLSEIYLKYQYINICHNNNIKYIYLSSLDTVTSTLNKKSEYLLSKLLVEKYLTEFINRDYINACVLRIGSVYGYPLNLSYKGVVNQFIYNALNDIDILIYDKNIIRKFLQIEDLSDIFINIISNDTTGIFNINGLVNIFIEKLACQIIEYTNSKSSLKYITNINKNIEYQEKENVINNFKDFHFDCNNSEIKVWNNVKKIIHSIT